MGQYLSTSIKLLSTNLIHWLRLGGWIVPLLYYIYQSPKYTIIFIIFYYYILSKTQLWADIIWNIILYGKTEQFSILLKTDNLNHNRSYIFSIHPHGLMCEGCFYSIIFNFIRFRKLFPYIKIYLAAGNEVKLLPIFREILKHNLEDESDFGMIGTKPEEINEILQDPSRSLMICPGGFSEAVFTDANSKYEYAYLKHRLGFVKFAIFHNRDIVPVYQFGVSKLYYTLSSHKGFRARMAQKYRIPMVFWSNMLLTNLPTNKRVITMFGPPFDTSIYKLDQVKEAHEAYLIHLNNFYNTYRHAFGMSDRELKIIGDDYIDDEHMNEVIFNKPDNITIANERIDKITAHINTRRLIAPRC